MPFSRYQVRDISLVEVLDIYYSEVYYSKLYLNYLAQQCYVQYVATVLGVGQTCPWGLLRSLDGIAE